MEELNLEAQVNFPYENFRNDPTEKKKKKKAQINTFILKPQQLSQENHFIQRITKYNRSTLTKKNTHTHTHTIDPHNIDSAKWKKESAKKQKQTSNLIPQTIQAT